MSGLFIFFLSPAAASSKGSLVSNWAVDLFSNLKTRILSDRSVRCLLREADKKPNSFLTTAVIAYFLIEVNFFSAVKLACSKTGNNGSTTLIK